MQNINLHNYQDFLLRYIDEELDQRETEALLAFVAAHPAIGEELFFRAGLQGSLQKMLGNHHIAIWSVAIIFSAIHFQFYGFHFH